jgi:ABC-type multidrug transport system ATPase subunit
MSSAAVNSQVIAELGTDKRPLRAEGLARLELADVTKRWQRKTVLQRCSLSLPAGAAVALVGRNGVGKTTLLRIAGGLIAPDEGSVALDGLHPFKDRRRYQERLGYVSAGQGGVYPRLRVEQMLKFWAGFALIPRSQRTAAIASVAEPLGLEGILQSRLDRISSGQRQRVRLALGFMHDPKLILLDEPHTSLDADGMAALAALVAERIAANATVVCCAPTSQELGITMDLAYVVEDGEVQPA